MRKLLRKPYVDIYRVEKNGVGPFHDRIGFSCTLPPPFFDRFIGEKSKRGGIREKHQICAAYRHTIHEWFGHHDFIATLESNNFRIYKFRVPLSRVQLLTTQAIFEKQTAVLLKEFNPAKLLCYPEGHEICRAYEF